MEEETISKLIPVAVLLILGIIESIGGMYFDNKRSKNKRTFVLSIYVKKGKQETMKKKRTPGTETPLPNV